MHTNKIADFLLNFIVDNYELKCICFYLQLRLANFPTSLLLAYQSFGVVYGDLSTSPLYVFKSIFVGKLQNHQNPDAIFGVFSLIFWTLTLIPLLKYIFIVLSADDNGEGMLDRR